MATTLQHVDSHIWKACAGSLVQIPVLGSLVYYFPQAHADLCSSPPPLSPLATSKPLILCRILHVHFLADPDTDEVFANISLQPLPRPPSIAFDFAVTPTPGPDVEGDEESDQVISFVKVLTPSDANNGCGFSVPRLCADSIFPPLNFQDDPPVQKLSMTDIHGVVWEFRHVYRGMPRRHLLTTGWSKFVYREDFGWRPPKYSV